MPGTFKCFPESSKPRLKAFNQCFKATPYVFDSNFSERAGYFARHVSLTKKPDQDKKYEEKI
jgi:hypothetical protein